MGSGDQSSLSDAERKNLLDEIRRRAEQAETERLDQDEHLAADGAPTSSDVAQPAPVEPQASAGEPAEPQASPVGSSEARPAPPDFIPPRPSPPEAEARVDGPEASPFPMPTAGASESEAESTAAARHGEVSEERIAILKERLTIAIDRGKVDRASSILGELRHLVPDDTSLPDFEIRLKALTVSNAPPEPPPAPPPPLPPPTPTTEPAAGAPAPAPKDGGRRKAAPTPRSPRRSFWKRRTPCTSRKSTIAP